MIERAREELARAEEEAKRMIEDAREREERRERQRRYRDMLSALESILPRKGSGEGPNIMA